MAEETTIRQLLTITPGRTELSPEFQIRATVTALGEGIATPAPRFGSIVVEDDTGAMWVNLNRAANLKLLKTKRGLVDRLEVGTIVELQGHVADGAFAPVILPTHIAPVGHVDLPTPSLANLETFLRGGDYLRTVAAQGVVQSAAEEKNYGWLLRIETGLGHFLCRVPSREPYTVEKLLDARVRIKGVAAVSRNWRREFVCPRLIVARDEDFEIIQPPIADPFQAEAVELGSLNAFSSEGTSLHRICIEGVVTYSDNVGRLFVQEGDFAVRVEVLDAPTLSPGDFVEVAGFVDSSRHVAGLSGALVRVKGKRPIPEPVRLSFSQVLKENDQLRKGQIMQLPGYDGIYTELSGTVLSHHFDTLQTSSAIELDCGDSVSTVLVMGNTKPIAPGSVITAKGAAKFEYNEPLQTAYNTPPSKLDLLVSGNTMIEVIAGAPWWTAKRGLTILVIAACLGCAAIAWALSLRRALRRKAQQLAVEMNSRHDAALEFQAALRERTRLAANLHDTLLQTMSGIGYQLEACTRQLLGNGHAQSNLETAKRMVQRGQADLRGSVWALRAMPQKKGPFADSVHRVVHQIMAGHECDVKIEVASTISHLADFVAGNLLLVIQESTSNALRHAKPKQIVIEVKDVPHSHKIRVSVTDDGEGFSVGNHASVMEGHFGIQGMKERIETLSGEFMIDSQPHQGTTVTAVVPIREFDDLLEES